MNRIPNTLLFCVFFFCGLQEATPSQRGRCAEGLCFFEHLVDFRGAEKICAELNGKLSESSSKDMTKLYPLLDAFSGRSWLHRSGATDCVAISVGRGTNATVKSEPCRDKLDGFVCYFKSSNHCGALQESGETQMMYTITTALTSLGFEVVDSKRFPAGTVLLVSQPDAHYPESKFLCFEEWLRAPWRCEVLSGGCDSGMCDKTTNTCTCPNVHVRHPNNFSCVAQPTGFSAPELKEGHRRSCEDGYKPAADGGGCVAVDECEEGENTCTAEGKECVYVHGRYQCNCKHGFDEEDGVCVNISICHSCEHMNCSKIDGVYQCVCNEGFRVSSKDPTKCEQHCPKKVCPAICHRSAELQDKTMQQCTCPDGFILDRNNITANCMDIDECEHQKMCDHKCENLFGSYRCLCERGFKLESGETCVPLEEGKGVEEEEEDEEESVSDSPLHLTPASTSGSILSAVLPSYIKTGSVLGITVFMLLCIGLLVCLVRHMTKRCGKLNLTSIKHPDIDIFYLHQVTTETYKRLSFDKESKTDSLKL